ncbi:MAG: Bifunctional NAD(P)H-hydrate repair enzyme Nnr [Includes: ADP-dependent (S)-NAD(P)H-hydrate dehydratase; NAD(P)H-hydrate epimerase] [Nitrospira sp.]
MKVVTVAQMQALDRRTIVEGRIPGIVLMERAGQEVVKHLEAQFGSGRAKTITVVCGKGNNGGDGLVVARLLHRHGAKVHALLLTPVSALTRDAAVMYRRFIRAAGKSSIIPFRVEDRIRSLLAASDLVIDAILGTGLSTDVTGTYREAINLLNQCARTVVAVDIPSGIHADSGSALGVAVDASLTVTFGLPKLGLYVGQGIDHAGIVQVADIGIPPSFAADIDSHVTLLVKETVRQSLPRRRASSHKGTFGHAGIIAGSVGKTGAAALAAQAALRTGAGLVTVAAPSSVNDVLEAKLLEVMTVPLPETEARTLSRDSLNLLISFVRSKTAVAVGPGLSTQSETAELVRSLLKHLDLPSVMDADALSSLAGQTSLLADCTVTPILTPHPGEMARLESGATAQSINADRIGTASRFSRQAGVILVLKGARSVIARPDGLVAICPTGNPGMATAGTGDVLTGMTVGLLAQGLPPWEAACAATYIHGMAGDLAAQRLGEAGMLARDVIEQIPYAFQAICL